MANVELGLVACGILLYAAASVLAVARALRPNASAAEPRIAILLIVGSLPFAVALCLRGLQAGRLPAFGRFETLTVYSLTLVCAYLLQPLKHRTAGISAILVPFVTVLLLCGMGVRAEASSPPFHGGTVWLSLHLFSACVGFALCTLAGILGLTYLVQDNNLKRKRLGAVFARLPALETLDHLMARQIGGAFLMLTFSLAIAVRLIHLGGGGAAWLRQPGFLATVASWGVYAALMHMRTNADRHGKRMALLTTFGLLFVLFAFLGVHVVAQGMLGSSFAGAANFR